ncbi:hypothetical protein GXW74_13820 [Roseomonas eburnea]|uniref:Uncharacterized protein n=1 Tax=Neoroseomonas eburnea TaxID=1346889 RepID=A0A9X9XCY3_9PROT|nr:hypothetical protein [Neoroseomonas eburnea]MBR0681569.1 hypothetical protein [Neoroseomonas eburnea]
MGSGAGSAPRLVVDGEDSDRGRGLLLLSALHLAAPHMRGTCVEVMNAEEPPMRAAIESLRWETGLNVRATLRAPEDVLPGAALFVAIAVAGADHLPLAQAAAAGVPVLVPLQFPSDDAPPGTLLLARAAHDPGFLAERMLRHLPPRQPLA